MAEEKIKIAMIVLEPLSSNMAELVKLIGSKDQANVISIASSEEAKQIILKNLPCMLVACIQENSEVPSRVRLLKQLESPLKYGLLKTMIASKLKNAQLQSLISGLGVTDYIQEPVPLRTLQFKANLQLKAVDTVRKQQEMKKQSQEKIVFKKSDQKMADGTGSAADITAKQKPEISHLPTPMREHIYDLIF